MNSLLAELETRGLLAPEAASRIAEFESRERVPLARELHMGLYLGAALVLVGVGAAVKDRLDQIGPLFILAALGLGAAACLGYCVLRTRPFAPGKVMAPTVAFDYVLYLGCGLTGIFFSYLEWKWKLLGSWWDLYLFGSGLAFAALAYRFDNRLVLTTALLNLAAWLGFRAGRWDFFPALSAAKPALIVYGAALVGAARITRDSELKPHFEDTYFRAGVHFAFAALLADADRFTHPQFWFLTMACAALSAWALRARRFEMFATAVAYAYFAFLASMSSALGHGDFDAILWIVLLSSAAVIAALLWARARFKESAS